MKKLHGLVFALWTIVAITASLVGCADTIHKPTTVANAGTAALVAYSVAGAGVGEYLALPLCAKPPVYPCKTQAINDRLAAADIAAYNAAVAADHAVNDAAAQAKSASANQDLNSILKEAKGGRP
jgi:hypothetical protein